MYMHDWATSQLEGFKNDFNISDADLVGVEILLASYVYEDYDGSAFVLFRRDGKLWEVNGSHCSCYGLEECWEPEEATLDSLQRRLDSDSYTLTHCHSELVELIRKLKAE
ncbi:hypothetical protein D3C85_90000 [compost metagenome]